MFGPDRKLWWVKNDLIKTVLYRARLAQALSLLRLLRLDGIASEVVIYESIDNNARVEACQAPAEVASICKTEMYLKYLLLGCRIAILSNITACKS